MRNMPNSGFQRELARQKYGSPRHKARNKPCHCESSLPSARSDLLKSFPVTFSRYESVWRLDSNRSLEVIQDYALSLEEVEEFYYNSSFYQINSQFIYKAEGKPSRARYCTGERDKRVDRMAAVAERNKLFVCWQYLVSEENRTETNLDCAECKK